MSKIFINTGHCVGVAPGACGNGLKEISYAANQWSANLFVSITTTRLIRLRQKAQRRFIAQAMHNHMTKTFLELTDKGVKTAAYSILYYIDICQIF